MGKYFIDFAIVSKMLALEIDGKQHLMEDRKLKDVDATNLNNNETVVYDEASDKFVIKELPIVNGGTF